MSEYQEVIRVSAGSLSASGPQWYFRRSDELVAYKEAFRLMDMMPNVRLEKTSVSVDFLRKHYPGVVDG